MDFYRRAIHITKPLTEGRWSRWPTVRREANQLSADFEEGGSDYAVLWGEITGHVAGYLTFYLEYESTRRLAMAALACERYRLAHGRWPDRIGNLVPEYAPDLPSDPASGLPFKVVPTYRGLRLVACGPDGTYGRGLGQGELQMITRFTEDWNYDNRYEREQYDIAVEDLVPDYLDALPEWVDEEDSPWTFTPWTVEGTPSELTIEEVADSRESAFPRRVVELARKIRGARDAYYADLTEAWAEQAGREVPTDPLTGLPLITGMRQAPGDWQPRKMGWFRRENGSDVLFPEDYGVRWYDVEAFVFRLRDPEHRGKPVMGIADLLLDDIGHQLPDATPRDVKRFLEMGLTEEQLLEMGLPPMSERDPLYWPEAEEETAE
jgi:hypothetical protein